MNETLALPMRLVMRDLMLTAFAQKGRLFLIFFNDFTPLLQWQGQQALHPVGHVSGIVRVNQPFVIRHDFRQRTGV